jgi:hypothetical protein
VLPDLIAYGMNAERRRFFGVAGSTAVSFLVASCSFPSALAAGKTVVDLSNQLRDEYRTAGIVRSALPMPMSLALRFFNSPSVVP